MINNLHQRIAKLLEDHLNNQSDMPFKVFINVENLEDFLIEEIDNYKVVEKEYIPVILTDFAGNYIPLTDKKALNQSVNAYLVTKTKYQEEVETILLNHLTPLIVGKQYPLDTAQAVLNMSPPRNSDVYTINGYDFVNYIFTLHMRIGEGFIFGNQVSYYLKNPEDLDFVKLTPTQPQTDLSKSPLSAQVLNELTAKSIIQENIKKTTLSFYYIDEAVYHSIVQEIETDVEQNKVYDLKIVYPGFEVTKKVIVESGVIVNTIGDFSSITVVFTPASEVLYNG